MVCILAGGLGMLMPGAFPLSLLPVLGVVLCILFCLERFPRVRPGLLLLCCFLFGFCRAFCFRGIAFLWNCAAECTIPLPVSRETAAVWSIACLCLLHYRSTVLRLIIAPFPLLCTIAKEKLPNPGFLSIYLWGILLVLLSGCVNSDESRQRRILGYMAALPGALLILGLWQCTARLSYPPEPLRLSLCEAAQRLHTPFFGFTLPGRTEPQEAVQLSRLSAPKHPERGVMTVTAQTSTLYYLRGQDFDIYTGTAWIRSTDRPETFDGWGAVMDTLSIHTIGYETHSYLPYYPAPGTRLRDGEQVCSLRDYAVTVYSEGSASSESVLQPLTDLPDSSRTVLSPLLEAAGSTPEAIRSFVSSAAPYDLNADSMPSDCRDFALWFLTDADSGRCVHYAAAAAALLRCAGIPARYVTGYLVQTQAGTAVTVTNADAHAWTEYYDRQQGRWCILDATPSAVPEPVVSPAPRSHPQFAFHLTIPLRSVLAAVLLVPVLCFFQGLVRCWLQILRRRIGPAQRRVPILYAQSTVFSRILRDNPPDSLETLLHRALYSQHPPLNTDLEPFHVYRRQCLRRIHRKPFGQRLYLQLRYGIF